MQFDRFVPDIFIMAADTLELWLQTGITDY